MRILAIDDDPIFAESIKETIEVIGHTLIDVVPDISTFKRLIKATDPELLIIDIDLGEEMNGIELASSLSAEIHCPFIFITSHQDLATTEEAIELLPAAYITKPVNNASLLSAIALAESKEIGIPDPKDAKGLFIKVGSLLKKFDAEDITYIEVMDKSCFLHTSEGKIEVNIRLKELKKQLPESFIQIHRSYVINMDAIKEVDTQVTQVGMNPAQHNHEIVQLPVGRSYKKDLLRNMNRIG